MHIADILAQQSPTLSFEFFPPKTQESSEALYQTIGELEAYKPSFVSVTYGAGGSTRELTHDLVVRIKKTTTLDPVPHLTCVCHSEADIASILERYAEAGVSNILALGGDPPRNLEGYDRKKDAFQQAADLVRFIKKFNDSGAHPDKRAFPRATRRLPTGCWRWIT
jgi:methylenetetrahydrofolate reductase (NADPH)